MVAAATPYAAHAAVRLLESGGNAVDAAAAAAFALMVTDPPMASAGGRTQILIARADGTLAGIDGATMAPTGVPPLAGEKDDRLGYAVVPVPGNPAALAKAVREHGKKKLAQILQPAIELAERGFLVTPRIGRIWGETRERLARDPGAALLYLKPGGAAYAPGERYRNATLARTLRELALHGEEKFYEGPAAQKIVKDVSAHGGYLRAEDFAKYQALPAAIHRVQFGGFEVAAVGRRAWGGTLVEMLNILSQFELSAGEPSPAELEILARVISTSIADRLEMTRAARKEKNPRLLEKLATKEFALERAEAIRTQLRQPPPAAATAPLPERDPHETTHLAVMDRQGNAVSLTTSIGPRFGARVASKELGFMYGYSYRMREDPEPLARDETEMTPTILLLNGKPVLAVGAAGSERIPGAILQVIYNVAIRKLSLEQAVRAPRLHCQASKLQLDSRFPASVGAALRERGFEVASEEHDIAHHFGIVHAVQFDPAQRLFYGAADPVYDGAAAAPRTFQPAKVSKAAKSASPKK